MQPLTCLKQVSDWLSHVPLFLQRCECTGKSRSHPAWFEGLGEAGQEGVLPGIEEEGTGRLDGPAVEFITWDAGQG